MSTNLSYRKSQAFTLLELMLCLAIIAILISLLLPALNRSRDAVEEVRCRANLHMLAVAWHAVEDRYRNLASGADLSVRAALERELAAPAILRCPSEPLEPAIFDSLFGSSYAWSRGGMFTQPVNLSATGQATTILMWERSAGFHSAANINIVWESGGVEMITADAWVKSLGQQTE